MLINKVHLFYAPTGLGLLSSMANHLLSSMANHFYCPIIQIGQDGSQS